MKNRVFAMAVFVLVPKLVLAGELSCRDTASHIRFEEYAVSKTFEGPYKAPDISRQPERYLRTVILQGAEGAPDFAGRYKIVGWGCGAPCKAFALVDKETGRVHMAPFSAAFGAAYRLESRLFVVDPIDLIIETYKYGAGDVPPFDQRLFKTVYYAWDEDTSSFTKLRDCYGELDTGK